MVRPRVVLHNEVSLDGRIDGIEPDLGRFYALARSWDEDATLAGSDTILAIEEELGADGVAGPVDEGGRDRLPLLVVPDSRGRITRWEALRAQPFWRDIVCLVTERTPAASLDALDAAGVEYLRAGSVRVDFDVALRRLRERFGLRTVRVDSGGTLNGVLLRGGLVDEVSVLIEPRLVGGEDHRSMFRAPPIGGTGGAVHLHLTDVERFDDDVVWLRYEVVR